MMLKCVEGIYCDGKVELLETPEGVGEARVIVAFLPTEVVDLRERGVDEAQAAKLRWKFQAFAEDWERPEMDVYDEL